MADQESSQQPTRPAADSPDPFIGRVIVGKLRLMGLLGVGAMGRVYEAEHLSLSKKIAVKVLHRHLMGDEGLARRFHREARSASTLNHPNSISIMDFGQDQDGTLYIAMELLEGRNLIDVLQDDPLHPLALDRTVHILSQVCLALDEAHHNKIVHRDLKAENVMVMDRRDETDFVKVCDFGIAKVQDPKADNPDSAITVAGMVCGTPEYMSPEQARGEPLDGRSDLYSLGILLYYMVTDRLPFTAETALGCVTKHLTEAPTPPRDMRPDLNIPPVLDAFVLRTIAKDPDLRPATALAFKEELEAVAAQIAAGDPGEPKPSLPLAQVQQSPVQQSPRSPAPGGAPTVAGMVPYAPTEDVADPGPPRLGRAPLVVGVAVVLMAALAAVFFLTRPSAREAAPLVQTARPDGGGVEAHATSGAPDAESPGHRLTPDAAVAVAGMDASAPGMGRGHRRRRRRPAEMRPAQMRPAQMRPDPRAHSQGKTPFQVAYDRARAAFNAGRVSAAVRQYKAALGHRPGDARTLRELGRCHVRLGQPCRALRYYKRYARLRPGDFFVKRHIRTLSPRCGGMR